MLTFYVVRFSFSQSHSEEEFLQNVIPKEQVYLHINTTLLFSGEKLLYKFYNLNSKSKTLSNLSKIGWVKLINSDKKEIFSHKLDLIHGKAYSDFFIPSNLPTGNYKILGYTTWMLNAKENYFEQDVFILNPYQNTKEGVFSRFQDKISNANVDSTLTKGLNINLDKNNYSTREKVELSLENISKLEGNFSLSVRKIEMLDKPYRIKSEEFSSKYNSTIWDFSDTLILPEIRGAYFRGKVSSSSVSNFKRDNLCIAFPGEESQLNIVSLSRSGEFDFTLGNTLGGQVFFQLENKDINDFEVHILENPIPEYKDLNFDKKINIDENSKAYILDKSIDNQIENAYSILKADQLIMTNEEGYFFKEKLVTYNLDEYTRFKEITDTFIEIIKFAKIKKDKNGADKIFVNNENYNGFFSVPALLIVDGVIVKDHSKLVSYGARKIKHINLLTSKIFYGPQAFLGVVTVETKTGDFPKEFMDSNIKSITVTTTQPKKEYYYPNYDSQDLTRIPDNRYQLWWNPDVSIDHPETFNFYTSDLFGEFEVILEGFTNEGKPVSLSETFVVE